MNRREFIKNSLIFTGAAGLSLFLKNENPLFAGPGARHGMLYLPAETESRFIPRH